MRSRAVVGVVLVFMVAVLVGCTGPGNTGENTSPPAEPPAESPSSGLRLAPGLYDLENGKVQAVGTLEWRDLEGGFWAVVGGTEADGGSDKVQAVIANGDEFEKELEPLKGKLVLVTGTRVEGASIRMAGPEISMESVTEMSDTPGIAE